MDQRRVHVLAFIHGARVMGAVGSREATSMKYVDGMWHYEPDQPMSRAFANHPMMRELHAIREKHDQQTQSAPTTERNQLTRFLSSHGYTLIPTKRGTRKLVQTFELT